MTPHESQALALLPSASHNTLAFVTNVAPTGSLCWAVGQGSAPTVWDGTSHAAALGASQQDQPSNPCPSFTKGKGSSSPALAWVLWQRALGAWHVPAPVAPLSKAAPAHCPPLQAARHQGLGQENRT